jgi:lipopolysaccharide transport system permease protein
LASKTVSVSHVLEQTEEALLGGESANAPTAPSEPAPDDVPVTIIDSRRTWLPIDFRELWQYRELLLFFTWRDIKLRYKQTLLGAIWAVIQPLLTTGVFAVLFSALFGRGNEPTVAGVPYVLSTFCAMLPWQLFAEALTRSGRSLLQERQVITKVYFPRIILPTGATFSAIADFAVALVILFVLILWFGVPLSWSLLAIPLFFAWAVLAAVAVGMWLSALSAMYRDFEHVQPFLIRLGMFVSPVVYTTTSLKGGLSDWALALYCLNPMVGVIEGFRWSVFGTAELSVLTVVPSLVMTAAIFISAMFYFRRMEDTVIDVI